jgi:hypothetical protein
MEEEIKEYIEESGLVQFMRTIQELKQQNLLEALRAVDEWFEGDRKNEPKTWLELGKLVKQAIAKAEGK